MAREKRPRALWVPGRPAHHRPVGRAPGTAAMGVAAAGHRGIAQVAIQTLVELGLRTGATNGGVLRCF